MREECRMRAVNATLAMDTTADGIRVALCSLINFDFLYNHNHHTCSAAARK